MINSLVYIFFKEKCNKLSFASVKLSHDQRILCMKRIIPPPIIFMSFMLLVICTGSLSAQSFIEDFESLQTCFSANGGWSQLNRSSPAGTANWNRNDSIQTPYGTANSAITATALSVNTSGTISNWLFTPVRELRTGDTLRFFTKSLKNSIYPDRLEVRLSLQGANTQIAGANGVGNFTTLLLTVNPTLQGGSAYPMMWTQYTVVVPYIETPTMGRFAFRYYVTNAGNNQPGTNASMIALDRVEYKQVNYNSTVSNIMSPVATECTNFVAPRFRFSNDGLSIVDSVVFNFRFNADDYQLWSWTGNVQPNNTIEITMPGRYCFPGPNSFELEILKVNDLPAYNYNIVNFNVSEVPALELGDPATYCGTATINPSLTGVTYQWSDNSTGATLSTTQSGTYSLTVTNTDGCTVTDSKDVIVNPLPNVSLTTSQSQVCASATPVTLTGVPAGGAFVGNGVSGNQFNPALAVPGANTVTYTYTDANGCSNTDEELIILHPDPIIYFGVGQDTVCQDAPMLTLNASPAGGVFSGPGVSGGQFVPAANLQGVNTITYTYTDNNGCVASAQDNFVVDDCAMVVNPTSINTVNDNVAISVYPNPFFGNAAILIILDKSSEVTADLYDVQGRLISNLLNSVEMGSGVNRIPVNGTSLPEGMYILKLKAGTTAKSIKLYHSNQ